MRFILILIILIPLNAYTQSATSYKCDCKKIEYLKTVTSSDTIQDERYLACCHHCLGIEYYYDNEYLKAINHFEKAIDIRLKNNYDGLAKSYRNSGYCHKELGLYNKTISLINEAIQRSDKEKNRLANYVHLGSCYTSIGEFEKAENSLSTAFQLAESYENRAKVNNTSCILYTINESFKAIEYGEKATLLYEKAYTGGTKSVDSTRIFRDRATAYNNLGNAYRKVGKNEKAIKSYNFSIQSYQEINNVFLEAQTLNNVAAALYGQKKYKEAIKVSNESLQLKKKYYSNDLFNYTYAANHENLAENYEALDSIDKALYHYQYALINLTNNNFEEEDIQQSPNPSDSNLYVYNKIDLIRVLHLKASAAFKKYQKESDKTYLNLAEKTYNTAFQFHNQLPQQITTQESRLFQAKVILPFIENALAVAYELQEKQQQTPETAYRFMGKNKATVLLQSINEAKALEYAGLPKSLLNQEKELRETITAYEKQLNDARQYEEKEATKQYENLLSEQKNTYDQLIQNLENKHPEYYNLKYKQNTTTLKHAQNYLDNETALLEYLFP